jgi:hypothetical protein
MLLLLLLTDLLSSVPLLLLVSLVLMGPGW